MYKSYEDWTGDLGNIPKNVETISDDADAWLKKGNALADLEKYGEAIKCHDEAIRINPEEFDSWHNKGYSLGKLGKHNEAIKCYNEAIKIRSGY